VISNGKNVTATKKAQNTQITQRLLSTAFSCPSNICINASSGI